MKRFLILLFSSTAASLALSLFTTDDFLLNFIDYYFYFGLVMLMIGIFLFVSGKGFFDFFRWSSKKVFSGYNNSYEGYKSNDDANPLEFTLAKPLIRSGGIIIVITYIIAITIF